MKKVILITGASSGIGKETALRLVREGYTVYAVARRVEKMQDIVRAGGHSLEMDVTNETEIRAGVEAIITEQGKIDVLLNNAGYGLYGAVEDIPLDDARRQFEVNLFGLAALTRAVLPYMRAAGKGTIINTSSMGGKIYTPLGAWYHASKHALEGWSDCLRLELKDKGIDVVIIEPGIISTEFADVLSEPLLQYSGEGAYADLAGKVADSTKNIYERKGAFSPPSVVADAVLKAISATRPKTRYRIGKLAKPMVWLRTFLGDRIFDKAVMSQV